MKPMPPAASLRARQPWHCNRKRKPVHFASVASEMCYDSAGCFPLLFLFRGSCVMSGHFSLRLERCDPSRNMSRSYVLQATPSLFGDRCLIRARGADRDGGTDADAVLRRKGGRQEKLQIPGRSKRKEDTTKGNDLSTHQGHGPTLRGYFYTDAVEVRILGRTVLKFSIPEKVYLYICARKCRCFRDGKRSEFCSLPGLLCCSI
jgi:hypothetical protein